MSCWVCGSMIVFRRINLPKPPRSVLNFLASLSRGTVVLPLPAVSGEKTCELVADNDGDGKVRKCQRAVNQD